MKDNFKILYKKAKKAFHNQKDQSDCGVACLKSLVHFFGGEIKTERLRGLSGTTQRGTTMLGLYQAAINIGLQAEPYEADMENLINLSDPCVLHVIKDDRLQHYIICYGFYNDKFLISDPSKGVEHITQEELTTLWQSKVLLLLKPTENLVLKKENDREKWLWLRRLVEEDLNILGLSLALGIFITILSLSTAIFSQKLIDVILPERNLSKLYLGIGFLCVLLFSRSGLVFIRQFFLIKQSRDFNNRVINNFYSTLLRLPLPFFHNRKTGDLIARMNDTSRLQRTITFLIADLMIDILLVVVAAVYIMSQSLLLGTFLLSCVPVYFFLTWYYNKDILDGQRQVMAAHSANESNYVDTIQGAHVIKSGNKEPVFSKLTKIIYGFYQDQIFDLGKIGIKFGLWTDLIAAVFTICILLFSSMLVLSGEILIGSLVAILQMTMQLIPSVSRLSLTNIQIQEARVAFDRMYEFTSLKSEEDQQGGTSKTSIRTLNSLKVKNLSFRFPGRPVLLKDISFDVKKGEMISLLGESGCGKTTLFYILQQFFSKESGIIRINNSEDIENIPVHEWRDLIASVPQQTKIFNGTLIDNICLDEVTEEEYIKVVEFCNQTGLNEYFETFPQQYATLLGEEGINISGGQQQIVAIARALYQNPDLLLLDEPTSAMDRETEQKILKLLLSFKNKMNIVLVTHRVQSAKLADRIYIIEHGMITTRGTPDALAQQDNLFSRSASDLIVP